MSGIATYCKDLAYNISTPIAATRKTPWMLLDKKAVAMGGGLTHRLSLNDWVMVKDNHLKVLQNELHISAEAAVSETIIRLLAKKNPFFEIEVATPQQAIVAVETLHATSLQKQPMAIMLDNFTPETVKQTITDLQKSPVYENIIIEASGGITEKNLSDWDKTGADIISLGSLTHSSPNFDVSMRFQD